MSGRPKAATGSAWPVKRLGARKRRPYARRAAAMVADPRFYGRAAYVHRLGERATVEFMAELAARSGAEKTVDIMLDAYAAVRPEILRCLGGDRRPYFGPLA